MSTTDVLFTTIGPVAYLTFDRPETGNAMTWAMYDALVDACQRVDGDDGLRVFVLRATGSRFGTGTDIGQFAGFTSGDEGAAYEQRLEACLDRLERVEIPTIAQIHGPAAGAAFAIAIACDLRVCTPAASFGVPIARTLGNGLSASNCARLVDHLGPTLTKDLLFTGRMLDVAEARAAGLVTRVAEADAIAGEVRQLAETIAENAPLALRALKAAVRRVARHRITADGDVTDHLVRAYASADFREGVSAFLQKRPPRFEGH